MRAPSTVDLGVDRLDGYTLEACFHLTIATSPHSSVEGVLWEVDTAALARFDGIEGYPRYYDRIEVTLASGRRAWVYVMQPEASLVRGGVAVDQRRLPRLHGARDLDGATRRRVRERSRRRLRQRSRASELETVPRLEARHGKERSAAGPLRNPCLPSGCGHWAATSRVWRRKRPTNVRKR